MDKINISFITGWVCKWFVIAVLVLMAIYILARLLKPVIEQVNDALSSVGSLFSGGSNTHSLAVLCIVLIGAVALAKVLAKK